MVPCSLAGHRHCIVNNGSHTFHLHVFNLFIFVFKYLILLYFLQDCLCTLALYYGDYGKFF